MTTKILHGDCRETLKTLPDSSLHCCVTSPPYFGLRDYGNEAQIGLEQSPDAFVQELVSVFRQVKRVLRDDGTLWLNLGDSYAAQRGGTPMPAETIAGGISGRGDKDAKRWRESAYLPHRNAASLGLKHKDLIGIPWRVAFALQADGWYLRQDIIWHKPNPMPESVTDRCTKAHEYIFLLSKGPRYYFDAKAIAEPAKYTGITGMDGSGFKPPQNFNGKHSGGSETLPPRKTVEGEDSGFRNRRSVWTVTTKPYKGAHFATFPPDLIEPCILAGCPNGGTVLDPFAGSGTTAQVAMENNRNAILCELNGEYIDLIKKRLATIQPELI